MNQPTLDTNTGGEAAGEVTKVNVVEAYLTVAVTIFNRSTFVEVKSMDIEGS